MLRWGDQSGPRARASRLVRCGAEFVRSLFPWPSRAEPDDARTTASRGQDFSHALHIGTGFVPEGLTKAAGEVVESILHREWHDEATYSVHLAGLHERVVLVRVQCWSPRRGGNEAARFEDTMRRCEDAIAVLRAAHGMVGSVLERQANKR